MKNKFILLFHFVSYLTFGQSRTIDNNSKSITLLPEGVSVSKGTFGLFDDNVSHGFDALKNNQINNQKGLGNIGIGYQTLRDNTLNSNGTLPYGIFNTAVGHNSMSSNRGGNWNTAIGTFTLSSTLNPKFNTAVGYGAASSVGSQENVAIGSYALSSGYYGNRNTAIGTYAGQNQGGAYNETDSANVFLGYQAGATSGAKANKLYVANTDTDNPLIWGDFYAAKLGFHGKVGIGTKNPITNLQVYQVAGHSQILLNNSNIGATLTDGLSLISDTNGDAHILNKENKPLHFGANNFGSFMTVYPAGEVGIGLLGFLPSANLHLHETEAGQATKFKISNTFSNLSASDGFVFEYNTQGEMLMNNLEIQNIHINSNPNNSTPEIFVAGSSRVGIGTNSPATKLEVNGFTKLGSEAPAIKIKKLTTTTGSNDAAGNLTTIETGVTATKIIGIQVLVEYGPGQFVPSSYIKNGGYEFNFATNNLNEVEIWNISGNSYNIYSKPIKIIITYEE